MLRVPRDLEQGAHISLGWIHDLAERGKEPGRDTRNPLMEWADLCAPTMVKAVQAERPDVVLGSLFCMGLAEQLASALSVPWCFVNPSYYFGEASLRTWEADFVGLTARVFRYWFNPMAQRAPMVLHATDPVFDAPPPGLPAHHHHVGPLMWEMPSEAPAFVTASGPPWVLVSLSTLPQAGELAIARTAIQALAGESVRILVTLPAGHAHAEVGGVPDNVYLTDYVPHSAVLPNCCLVISHAGHGIVMKALYYGVPMVLVPWGRDQHGVAARAEALGVATVVSREVCSGETLAEAARRIVDDPGYTERARAIARRLQADDPVTRACEHVEMLMKHSPERRRRGGEE